MDQRALQGWHADPFGLHDRRYFSAGRPTRLVRDGDVESYDEPPEQEARAAGVFARARSDPAGGRATSPYPGVRRRRRRTGLVNAAVAIVVAAVVAVVAIEGGLLRHGAKSNGSASSGLSLAAFVAKSAKSTLGQKTADMTITATFNAGGTTVDAHGTGQIDFAANTAAIDLTANTAGATVVEDEIVTKQAAYLRLSVNGRNAADSLGGGGRHWVKFPFSEASSDPQSSLSWNLQLLAQQGARVVRRGTQNIGGLTCDEYMVTPTKQAMLAAAQRDWAKLGLSSSATAAARQALEDSAPPSVTIWLDPSRHITCQVAASLQLDTGALAGSAGAPSSGVQMLLTFTHYGVPVTITPPPQSDTFSL